MDKRYKRRQGEDESEYIYRLCRFKDVGEFKLNWKELTSILNSQLNKNYGESKYRKRYKDMRRGIELENRQRSNNKKPRLVISDIHLPFAIEGWLDFIKNTHSRYNCDEEIIINGDLFDMHQLSFHTSETDALSANDEYELAKSMVGELTKAFPNAKVTLGNHDLIIARRVKELGIDQRFIKTFHELYDLPKTWVLADDFVIDDVYYRHIGCNGGKLGHINSAISNRMSTVSSHLHANGGIGYITNPNGEMIFGLNTGALVDDKSYALRYGKYDKFKATLGCGVVYSSKEAYFIPMVK